MNAYLIVSNGKRYATNADTMADAEELFFESFDNIDPNFRVTPVDIDAIKNDPEVTFF